MTETINTTAQNPALVNTQELAPNTVTLGSVADGGRGEEGIINFEGLRARAADLLGRAAVGVQVGYHGVRAKIADHRMEYSASRMEKMDHKTALYTDLGAMALTGQRTETETASGEPAMPRTFIERHIDRKIDKRAHKKAVADTYAYRTEKNFGRKETWTGKSKVGRKDAKYELAISARRGERLARDKRIDSTKIDGALLNLGEGMEKRTSKNQRKAEEKLAVSIVHPMQERWRKVTRTESIEDIQRHYSRGQKHRAKQQELRRSRLKRPEPSVFDQAA